MRVRIKYSKQGLLKFIGHLDMMRSFQKLLRRTGIDVTFSEGYSPHMIMSYALPLGVGMTSDSEYVDVDLNQSYSSLDLVRHLNESAPDGIRFLDAREIPAGKAYKGMTLVEKADYTLSFRPGHEWPEDWKNDFREFMRKPEILAVKKGKKTEREMNIAPLIYQATVDPSPHRVYGIDKSGSSSFTEFYGDSADPDPDGLQKQDIRRGCLFLSLSAGSRANIRPELVTETFAKQYGYPSDEYAFQINRDELYADTADDSMKEQGQHCFLPLIELGTVRE